MQMLIRSLFFLALIANSALSKEKKITLGLVVFPPEVVVDDESGKCFGTGVDVVKKALPEFTITIICVPPIRIYRLIEQGIVDLTVNIKTTPLLREKVIFVEPPFRTLVLNIYGHEGQTQPTSISAIRGFSYNGARSRLEAQGYDFIDLPTSTDAVRMFAKGRSQNLLSYAGPAQFFLDEFPEDYTVKTLATFTTHFAISKISPYQIEIRSALETLAKERNLEDFNQILSKHD